MLEQEMADPVLVVHNESVDMSEMMTVRRDHGTRSADLDLVLRDSVVDLGHVRFVADRLYARSEDAGREAFVIRQDQDVGDPDFPLGIFDGEFAESQIGRLLNRLELTEISDRAVERDPGVRSFMRLRTVDRDKPREVVATMWLHDQMGHAPSDRIDDDIRQLAEGPIRAVDCATEI